VTSAQLSTDVSAVIDACGPAVGLGESRPAAPDVLYHLTDVDALLGIATNRCLWACLATTLNDALEVRHGVNLAVHLVRDRLSRKATEYDSALLAYLIDPTSAPKEVQFEMLPLCGLVLQAHQQERTVAPLWPLRSRGGDRICVINSGNGEVRSRRGGLSDRFAANENAPLAAGWRGSAGEGSAKCAASAASRNCPSDSSHRSHSRAHLGGANEAPVICGGGGVENVRPLHVTERKAA